MDRLRAPGHGPGGEARPKHAALPRPARGRVALAAPGNKSSAARESKRGAPASGRGRRP